jgi:hypothetical protein
MMHKYRAKPTTCIHGHKHASKREAARCVELHLLQSAGEIADLVVEPQYWLTVNGVTVKHLNGRRAGYKPDFGYTEPEWGQKVVEDVKSGPTMTEAATLRMAWFRALYPEIDLRVVR